MVIDDTVENREKRGKIFGEIVGKDMIAELPKLEKVLAITQTNENFTVGESLTIGDIMILSIFILAEDKWFKQNMTEIKSVIPRCTKIYENAMKNDIIRNYMTELKENQMPATGLALLY